MIAFISISGHYIDLSKISCVSPSEVWHQETSKNVVEKDSCLITFLGGWRDVYKIPYLDLVAKLEMLNEQ